MNKMMLFVGAVLLSSASVVEGACRFQGCKDFQGDNADAVFDVVGEAINNGDFNVEDIQALSGLADDLNNKTKCENGTCSVGLRPTSYLAVTAFSASLSAIQSITEPPYVSILLDKDRNIGANLRILADNPQYGLDVEVFKKFEIVKVFFGLSDIEDYEVYKIPDRTGLKDPIYITFSDMWVMIWHCGSRKMTQLFERTEDLSRKKVRIQKEFERVGSDLAYLDLENKWPGCRNSFIGRNPHESRRIYGHFPGKSVKHGFLGTEIVSDGEGQDALTKRFLDEIQTRQPFHPVHSVLTIEQSARQNVQARRGQPQVIDVEQPRRALPRQTPQNALPARSRSRQTENAQPPRQNRAVEVDDWDDWTDAQRPQKFSFFKKLAMVTSAGADVLRKLVKSALWLGAGFTLSEFAYEYYRAYGLDYNTDQVIEVTERQFIVWTNRINLLLEQLDNADVDEMLGISQ